MKNSVFTVLLSLLLVVSGCGGDDDPPPPPGPSGDTIAPAPVTDLSPVSGAIGGEIDLSWTATGDDGSTGTTSAYFVKYSTSAITAANFDSATTYVQTWTPLAPGNTDNYTLTGLTPGQLYYVAIKVLDEVPNVSPISNLPSANAGITADTTPPAVVVDLVASPGTNGGEIDLAWTAVGDDGNTGTATSYIVKYSLSDINAGNFAAATTYAQSWTPVAAGNTENQTLSGLVPGAIYYVAIKVEDEVPNTSSISNIAFTTAFLDVTAPAAITDLAASSGTSGGDIDLSWTAVGDDGNTGTATAYVVKFSTSVITAANFNSALTFTQSWTPLAAGNAENHTMTGLAPSQLYYIAIKVQDEVPNTSGISNVPSAVASIPPDTTPPAMISNLSATGSLAPGSVNLTWTAVGDDGNTGAATSYEVRYSASPINAGNWTSATLFGHRWIPMPPGGTESHTVSGLTPETTYYFGVVARDEVPNSGPVSNSPSAAPRQVFRWSHPTPYGGGPMDMWGTSSANIYGVGWDGAAFHYNGTAWTRMSTGTTDVLWDIWGSSNTDIFAVGSNGTILHCDGTDWSDMSSGTTQRFKGVWGSSSTDVFAVGDWGTVVHYDGNVWSSMTNPATLDLRDVWGTSPSDVWAVGTNNEAIHYDGSSWTLSPSYAGTADCVWGAASNDFWAGQSNNLQHWDGTSWTASSPGVTGSVYSIWGLAANDIYLVTWLGEIRHYDGSSWNSMTSGTTRLLRGIWGSSSSDVWVGAGMGVLLHYDGTSWSNSGVNLISPGPSAWAGGVWGSSSTDVFVAGTETAGPSALIWHYDGNSWSTMNPGTTNSLADIWGASSTDVFAVGNNGEIRHYDGSSWTQQTSGTTNTLKGVSGTASTDVFAVGLSGTILHYDGTSWTAMTSGTTTNLWGVWAFSSNYVIAVGNSGTVIRYNGTAWSPLTSGVSVTMMNVWGSSMIDVYAVGFNGTLIHYDGTSWSPVALGVTDNLYSVWGSSSSDVYVVGNNGVIRRFNGTSWIQPAVTATALYKAVWGSGANDVFLFGDNGVILHYP